MLKKCEKVNCYALYDAVIATLKLLYDLLFCCCKKKDQKYTMMLSTVLIMVGLSVFGFLVGLICFCLGINIVQKIKSFKYKKTFKETFSYIV